MTNSIFLAVASLLLFTYASRGEEECPDVVLPPVILSKVNFSVSVTVPAYLIPDGSSVPEYLNFSLFDNETEIHSEGSVLVRNDDGSLALTKSVGPAQLSGSGHHSLRVEVLNSTVNVTVCSFESRVLVIPAWLTLIPPIVTAFLAIAFRQVLLALLVGIWLGATLLHGYNPATAIMRTIDTYIVAAMNDHDHAAIIIGTYFLGGMIGAVQRSGGGLGMAKLFSRFAKSTRSACIACLLVCVFVFFDDYTCVLVAGNSLRVIMDTAHVSKDKFSFIVQSMAPSAASFVPISSWIGAQLGYVMTGFDNPSCNGSEANQLFVTVIKTLPYRYLPVMMIWCVVLVCVLNRDFGCMLTSEKAMVGLASETRRVSNPSAKKNQGNTTGLSTNSTEEDCGELRSGASDRSLSQDSVEPLMDGPLAPKPGIPHRWFNAVVPFFVVMVTAFVGMVVGGWQNVIHQEPRENVTVINIFSAADPLSAFIWGGALGTLVLFLMLLAQRILFLKEFMTAWVEGVKDVIEPLIILLLAWALGAVIQDIQTSNYIASSISGKVSANYFPVITTIIGYLMSYATGSAFGTMGILFPLLVPTVCILTSDSRDADDIRIQTAAAILSSCIFGNLMSPIADLTVLTRVSTQCNLTSHIMTASLYVLIVAFITIVFGALPVGAGWYPVWVAWILMPLILLAVFVIFSEGHIGSRSLFRRACPCLYTALHRLGDKVHASAARAKMKVMKKLRRRKRRSHLSEDEEPLLNETDPLLLPENDKNL